MNDGRHTSELRSVSRCRMRARSSTWARQADRPPAYRRGANYRTYKPSAISRSTQAKPGPKAMHIQRTPSGMAREAPTTRQQSAKQTHLWSTRVYVSRSGPASVSRTTCPLNIHESPSWRRWKRRRGGLAGGLIVITLICPLHIRIIDRVIPRNLARSDHIIKWFVHFY